MPGKGNWKNTAVASTAGMGTGKAQRVGGPSRHGQLKLVLSSTIMAISCYDLFFEKWQVPCQCKEMEEIKLLRDTWWVSSSTLWRCDWLCFSIMGWLLCLKNNRWWQVVHCQCIVVGEMNTSRIHDGPDHSPLWLCHWACFWAHCDTLGEYNLWILSKNICQKKCNTMMRK